MAKKKRNPDGIPPKSSVPRKPKARKSSTTSRPKVTKIPEEVILALKGLVGEESSTEGNTPREQAERYLHQAFEADDPAEVERLARQALEVWPDCADAYCLLAEEAKSPKDALRLYTEAVAAGERDIGPKNFLELSGSFWLAIETRPYMRAMNGLGNALWVIGRREEAVGHYETMLRLNPGDNQGIRYILATCLLELARDDELAALLEKYEDGSASWAYSAALLAFRREGDTPHSQAMLKIAVSTNSHVPDLLTGRKMMPSGMPPYIERGQLSEAVDYAGGNLRAWRASQGALDWLRRRTFKQGRSRSQGRSPRATPKIKGPTPTVKKRLTRLPQSAETVWQAEFRPLPIWINMDSDPVRPWFVLVVSLTDELILAQDILEEPPSSSILWDKLARAMEKPAMGEPHRPAEIQVRSSDLWDDLEPHLDDVQIRRSITGELGLMDEIVQQLVAHVCGRPPAPSLLEMPGVTTEQCESFFHAAAAYYRAAPWQCVASEETIKIECERFESGPWYAAVIGQMGMTPGFALYENPNDLVRMRQGEGSDEENARETVALSVTFGDRTEIQVPDLDAVVLHGWEIAAPEAYPSPMKKELGLVMRPPLSWELRLLEGCLRAIPEFARSHDRDDAESSVHEVKTGSGPLTLRLSWV